MTRLYEAPAYEGPNPSYWMDTVDIAPWSQMDGDISADVVVVGGGFTGLNAARTLAAQGASVIVVDSRHPAWGASGRNGGFCCLGGGKLPDGAFRRQFGAEALETWKDTQKASVSYVSALLEQNSIDVDRCSGGETLLAHSARAWRAIQNEEGVLHDAADLAQQGLGGPWFGGVTQPIGFGLNPAKYMSGLNDLCRAQGITMFQDTHVSVMSRRDGRWRLQTDRGTISADQVIVATNGYSSEHLPEWLRARYLPISSNVIVTRPLTQAEREAAGWTSTQMCYDSRYMLHYFRMLPDGRFLFGMRGGLFATSHIQARIQRKIRKDFNRMFPAWRDVEITHDWYGLLSMTGKLLPFVGPVPEQPGLFAALGYHGNGVAMASYSGHLLAQQMLGVEKIPDVLCAEPSRFPLGRHRRYLLAPAYLAGEAFDL